MPFHFYNTICGLRQREEIILYDRLISFIPEDEKLVTEFLHIEYDTECINYPFIAPGFDADAALWGAKTVYTFSQLLLYREHAAAALPQLLSPYQGSIDAAAILSADLCLRFLPELTYTGKRIDPDDSLLPLIEICLSQWHYSGIGYPLKNEELNMETIEENDCLLHLYSDRVIEKKDIKRVTIPQVLKNVKASLGLYVSEYWKDLKIVLHDEQH